uniref:Uncharacterized protein n=1 Tax=Avena sativa TaxID=4498 RepID=A0ACD5Y3G0_AVESA
MAKQGGGDIEWATCLAPPAASTYPCASSPVRLVAWAPGGPSSPPSYIYSNASHVRPVVACKLRAISSKDVLTILGTDDLDLAFSQLHGKGREDPGDHRVRRLDGGCRQQRLHPHHSQGQLPPYGRDFDGSIATGRFSNGRLTTDFLSVALGLPSSVPAYLDGSYTIDQLATGVCFASAATGLDALTAKLSSVIPLSQQLEYFKEYKGRLKLAKGEAVADKIIADALYVFSIGTNDFMLNYFVVPLRAAEYTPEEYATDLVSLAEAAVRDVHELGARKVMFSGIPPFGCVPVMRTVNHDAPGECNEEYNRVALRYNAEIQDAIGRLDSELGAGSQVVYTDVYDVPYHIIANPSGYGFENAAQGCCRTGLYETSVLCGVDEAFTCQDADKYVFFDSVHPSEKTYRILADKIVRSTLQVFL